MVAMFIQIINMSISASLLILAVLLLRVLLRKAQKWINALLWGLVAIRLICPFSFESKFSLIPNAETILVETEINPFQTNAPIRGIDVSGVKNIMTIFKTVWILGIVALLAYMVVSYCFLRRDMDTAFHYREDVFQSEKVHSPFVMGLIKPIIYLPYKIEGQDMVHVIAHEKAHVARRDNWWKPLGFVLATIHWFNPLVWVAYLLFCRDIEFACDEKVIREIPNMAKADYTQALLFCSAKRQIIPAGPLAFGEVGVKERVKYIMNYKKPTFGITILASIVCIVVAICFLTNPIKEYPLKITIPAGNQGKIYYANKQIHSESNVLNITFSETISDAYVVLKPMESKDSLAFKDASIQNANSVEIEVEKNAKYEIGLIMLNFSGKDIDVYLDVRSIEQTRELN